jgi:hypothetical protein
LQAKCLVYHSNLVPAFSRVNGSHISCLVGTSTDIAGYARGAAIPYSNRDLAKRAETAAIMQHRAARANDCFYMRVSRRLLGLFKRVVSSRDVAHSSKPTRFLTNRETLSLGCKNHLSPPLGLRPRTATEMCRSPPRHPRFDKRGKVNPQGT